MLRLKNVSVSIQKKKILRNVNVDFEKGKIYAIMGPNGSGKSTLAATVMGHPLYSLADNAQIILNDAPLQDLATHERAKKGICMTFQSPLSLSGVTIYQLLRYALDGRKDPLAIRKKVQKYAKQLNISEELLTRSLNDGFSGGERKKMELLQAMILEPSVVFFDEIDTGVDIDALKAIATAMNTMKTSDSIFIIITHYNRLLKYVKPDEVLIMRDGEIVQRGGPDLAQTIEKEGYENSAN